MTAAESRTSWEKLSSSVFEIDHQLEFGEFFTSAWSVPQTSARRADLSADKS